ncbi:eukaryotic peptide chain release factor GTP-binding subunit-like [Lycium ferocissimum]|uniref:eukaryotic peptide chain release factor GTP-binding subunit-like n=1 Tax=Lycium ferocissimum TaxID=112874 RepID=UPI00281697D3|nr:eukaryotic peptide chain release factor GTP-binding subunit-like [Lycium ferocissimum]
MVKENQDTQQTLAELATNISLPTKKFDETQIKKVNVCEDKSGLPKGMYQAQEGPFHEGPPMQVEYANYVNNSQEGYQRQNYQGGCQNQNQWRPQQGQGAYNNNNSGNYNNNYGDTIQGSYNNNNNFGNKCSNPYIPPKGQSTEQGSSRVEAMLETVLANQSKSERTLYGLTETVGSYKTAIQKLESQMRDISRQQDPPKKGGLPSDIVPNSKNGRGSADYEEKEVQSEAPIIVDENPTDKKVAGLVKKKEDDKFKIFYDQLKQLSLNFPFLEAAKEMPDFAKYLKDLLTKKKTVQHDTVSLTHTVSSIISITLCSEKGRS